MPITARLGPALLAGMLILPSCGESSSDDPPAASSPAESEPAEPAITTESVAESEAPEETTNTTTSTSTPTSARESGSGSGSGTTVLADGDVVTGLGLELELHPQAPILAMASEQAIEFVDPDNGALSLSVYRPLSVVDPTAELEIDFVRTPIPVPDDLADWLSDLPVTVAATGRSQLLARDLAFWDVVLDEAELDRRRDGAPLPPAFALWTVTDAAPSDRLDAQLNEHMSMRLWRLDHEDTTYFLAAWGAGQSGLQASASWAETNLGAAVLR